MLKEGLEEAIHADHAGKYPTDPEVFTSHVEEVGV